MRLYNGAPDRELRQLLDDRARVMAEARSRGILLTWFPVEERWAACSLLENFKYEPLSQFHSSRQGALDEAIATLAARPKP